MYAHTLQDPNNCRFENVEIKMKQRNTNCIPIDEITHTIHSVYIHKAELFSTVSLVYTQIHVEYCIGNAEDETICRGHQYKMQWCTLYARRRRKFLEVHCVCIFTSSYQNHMEPCIICICVLEAPCVHGQHVLCS